MADGEAAPERTGQPEDPGQSVGNPDWTAERDGFMRQLAEAQEREARYKQQLDGANKAFSGLRERGYKSWDDVVPHLDAAERLRKTGLDPNKFVKAFEPDEPEGKPGSDFDPRTFEEQMFEKFERRSEEKARERAEMKAYASISDLVESELKDEPEHVRKLARGFIRDELTERLVTTANADPDRVLKSVWADYGEMRKASESRDTAASLAELGAAANKPKPATGTKKGGQGDPQSHKEPQKRGYLGVDRSEAVAETERLMKARGSGRTSALS